MNCRWIDVSTEQGICRLSADNQFRTFLSKNGHPMEVPLAWRPVGAFEILKNIYLLILEGSEGNRVAWAFDSDLVHIFNVPRTLSRDIPPEHSRKIGEFLKALFEQATNDIRRFHATNDFRNFSKLPSNIQEWLMEAGLPIGLLSVDSKNIDQGHVISYNHKIGRRTREKQTSLLSIFEIDFQKIISAWYGGNTPELKSATGDDAVININIFFTNQKLGFIFCEEDGGFSYFLLWQTNLHSAHRVYVPQKKCLFHTSKESRYPLWFFAHSLLKILFAVGSEIGQWLDIKDKPVGAVMWPKEISHLGHFIWNEMSCIERIVKLHGEKKPYIYPLAAAAGVEHYGPVENLYQDLHSQIIKSAKTYEDAFLHAVKHGIRPVPLTGQYIFQASRKRILGAIELDPDLQAFDKFTGNFKVNPINGKRRLVIVFQLRLQNRVPVQYLEFLVRLTRELVKEHGSIGVIIDGLNRAPGKAPFHSMPVFGLNRKNAPVTLEASEEVAFANSFCERVEKLKVEVVNCIGTTMLTNILWLSKADYFVAPMGGGLVKLRWILDLPGIILSSRINLEKCLHKDIYSSDRQMEAPFCDVVFTEPDDVKDITPPGGKDRTARTVPFEDNFELKTNKVINKIKDEIRKLPSLEGKI